MYTQYVKDKHIKAHKNSYLYVSLYEYYGIYKYICTFKFIRTIQICTGRTVDPLLKRVSFFPYSYVMYVLLCWESPKPALVPAPLPAQVCVLKIHL